MSNHIEPPSRDEVRLELSGRLLADALRISGLHGGQATARLLGKAQAPADKLVHLHETLTEQVNGLPVLSDVKLDDLPVGRLAMAVYDYAFEFQHPIGMTPDVLSAEMEGLEDFAFEFKSEVATQFMMDRFHMQDAGNSNWLAVPLLCEHARARVTLDLGEYALSLRQIGLLARMSEGSIRNALSASGDQQLRASGGMVENGEARRWLLGRRDFVATRFTDISQTPGEHPAKLATFSDLGHYLRARWDGLGKTDQAIVKELGWSRDRIDYLGQIIASPQSIDPQDCDDLARSLLVSSRWFTEQVMRLRFPRQMDQLLPNDVAPLIPVQAVATQVPQKVLDTAASELGADRICTRLMFILEDGTKVFPARMKRRGTGTVAFRVAPGGAGNNTLEAGLEVENEDEMIDMVINKSCAVRMTGEKGGMKNLYKRDGRLVRAVYVDGQLI